MADYYDILGVSKSASKDEIKKAFHKLAHKHHPDKQDGDEAKFKEINEAYQTLSDDSKRAQYDQFGQAGPQGFGGGGFGGFDFSQGTQGFDMGDINDIFGDFFGGGRRQTRERKGRDIATEMSIAFKDSVFGVQKTVVLPRTGVCKACNGTTAEKGSDMKTCSTCKGHGRIQEERRTVFGSFVQESECSVCFGKGKIPEKKCSTCDGKGVNRYEDEIQVTVPAGILNGETLKIKEMGEAISHGKTGDLYIKIHVVPHKEIKREGMNLLMNLEVKLTEALLGGKRDIETLDGPLSIKIPEGITHGELLRVKEKGVSDGRKRGDLFVRIQIHIPKKLSKKVKNLIEELEKEGI